jgi:hypothetical protein
MGGCAGVAISMACGAIWVLHAFHVRVHASKREIIQLFGIHISSVIKIRLDKHKNKDKSGLPSKLPKGLAYESGIPQLMSKGQVASVINSWSSKKFISQVPSTLKFFFNI